MRCSVCKATSDDGVLVHKIGCAGETVEQKRAVKQFGPCERDASGACLGRCGRRGHLGRALTIAEWLSFFGPNARHAKDGAE